MESRSGAACDAAVEATGVPSPPSPQQHQPQTNKKIAEEVEDEVAYTLNEIYNDLKYVGTTPNTSLQGSLRSLAILLASPIGVDKFEELLCEGYPMVLSAAGDHRGDDIRCENAARQVLSTFIQACSAGGARHLFAEVAATLSRRPMRG
jgi:hypothetical protein